MKCYRFGKGIVYVICAMLTIAAFLAGDFVLYQFHTMPSDYSFARETEHPPVNVDSAVWFTYGSGEDLTFWTDVDSLNREVSNTNRISMYAKTVDGDMLWVCKYFKPVIDDDGNFRSTVEPDEERNPWISEMVSSCFLHIADGTAIYACGDRALLKEGKGGILK